MPRLPPASVGMEVDVALGAAAVVPRGVVVDAVPEGVDVVDDVDDVDDVDGATVVMPPAPSITVTVYDQPPLPGFPQP